MVDNNNLIKKYKEFLISGHNNENRFYRYLAYIYPLYLSFKQLEITAIKFTRYQVYASGARTIKWNKMSLAHHTFAKKLMWWYIFGDIIYSNLYFKKRKGKFLYSLDLLLFNLLATYYLPFKFYNWLSKPLGTFMSMIIRNRSFIIWGGVLGLILTLPHVSKASDLTTDFILNYTFRRYIGDYRLPKVEKKKKENPPIPETIIIQSENPEIINNVPIQIENTKKLIPLNDFNFHLTVK
jgi:hypothetical protein